MRLAWIFAVNVLTVSLNNSPGNRAEKRIKMSNNITQTLSQVEDWQKVDYESTLGQKVYQGKLNDMHVRYTVLAILGHGSIKLQERIDISDDLLGDWDCYLQCSEHNPDRFLDVMERAQAIEDAIQAIRDAKSSANLKKMDNWLDK